MTSQAEEATGSPRVSPPPSKRQKEAPSPSMFSPALLSSAAAARARNKVAASKPYPHLVLRDVCDPARLRLVREEVIEHLHATYKETDLFRMFQTGDLANLDRLPEAHRALLPNLLALRAALCSPEFRSFLSETLQCGPLGDAEAIDGACNVHAQGGHLLCHDDVIGDRRVSYILYLTDADEAWMASDGGALELYPQEPPGSGLPGLTPETTLLPAFNSLAAFVVRAGESFHAIQEVHAESKPRMSIQGWFHAPKEEESVCNSEATLQMLQAAPGADAFVDLEPYPELLAVERLGDGAAPETNAKPPQPSAQRPPLPTKGLQSPLTEADVQLLRGFVHPEYLRSEIWAKIRPLFAAQGSIQLANFLLPAWVRMLGAASRRADALDSLGQGSLPAYAAGVGDGWRGVGPAFKQRFLEFDGEGIDLDEQAVSAWIDSNREALKDADKAPENDASTNLPALPASILPSSLSGALLQCLQRSLFSSPAFARLLHALTDIPLVARRGSARRFRPGLDYTVAHYGVLTQDPQLDAVLCVVDDAGAAEAEAWASGEVGGYEAYLLADDEEKEKGAADVYRAGDEDESGVLNVSPACNTLSLVLRDEGLMRFVKFVSARAPGSRWDLSMVYEPEPDSDSDEEGREEEEA